MGREAQIVQDADRVDAMGAIGIARAFAFGGHQGAPLCENGEEDAPIEGSTIMHFYDKLLHLRGTMNTVRGRELAEARDEFMRAFLARFCEEWRGD